MDNVVDLAIYDQLEKLGIKPVRQYEEVERIKTGLPSLDWALCGGLPRGRVVSMWGAQNYGKTSVLLCAAGNIIANGGKVLYVDMENALDHRWAAHWGCNPENQMQLISLKGATANLNAALKVLENNDRLGYDLIILDSIADAYPDTFYNGEMGEGEQMGQRAQMQARFMRRVKDHLRDNGACFVYINQVGQNFSQYGYDYKQTGSEAMRHHTSVEIVVYTKGVLKGKVEVEGKEKEVQIGFSFKGQTKKNKTGPADRNYEVPIITYDSTYHYKGQELFDLAYEKDFGLQLFTTKEGKPYSGRGVVMFNGVELGSSKSEAISNLHIDPELYALVEKEVYNRMKPNYSGIDNGTEIEA